MSMFLGPIHFWMYDKILIAQRLTFLIEKEFLTDSEKQENENLFSSVIDGDLEEIIDQNNIHQWLNQAVTQVELRFSFTIKRIIDKNISIDKVKEIAFSYGESFEKYDIKTPKQAYELLMDTLLDGLPCDVSISIIKEEDNSLEFVLHNDIHKEFFKEFEIDNQIYHQIRESFVNGLLNKYSFRYKNLTEEKKLIEKI